jgi:hypothetical protein
MRTRCTLAVLGVTLCVVAPATPSDALSRQMAPSESAISRPRWGTSNLAFRCRSMLKIQTEVLRGSEALHRELTEQKDGKATPAQVARCLWLAVLQDRAQREGVRMLLDLRSIDSAIAFIEVVEQLVKEMEQVRRALAEAAPNGATLTAARDAVDTLQDTIHALERTRQLRQAYPRPDQESLPVSR